MSERYCVEVLIQVAADYRCLNFHFQHWCRPSYQPQLNVKMFPGSQTKPWGDNVSADGALFCSVATALAHAGFRATICRLLLAQEKFATQLSSDTFTQTGKVGWAYSTWCYIAIICWQVQQKIYQIMWQEQTQDMGSVEAVYRKVWADHQEKSEFLGEFKSSDADYSMGPVWY